MQEVIGFALGVFILGYMFKKFMQRKTFIVCFKYVTTPLHGDKSDPLASIDVVRAKKRNASRT